MASKVNVKFVVILSACLVLAAVGVGGAYFFVKYRSGDRYVSRGDSAMKEGKIELADRWYERAVGKDPTNVEWLRKWRAAREQKVPKTEMEYGQDYQMYQRILRSLSLTLKNDVKAHRDYLESIFEQVTFSPGKGAWEFLAQEAEDHLRFFDADPPVELLRIRGIANAELTTIDRTLPQETRDKAGKDLQAVLKADPKDGQAATELAVWYRSMAELDKAAGNLDAQKRHFDAARQTLTDLIARDPGNAFAAVNLLVLDASDVELIAVNAKSPGEIMTARGKAMDALAPRVKEVGEVLKAAGPAKVSPMLIARFVSIAPRIDTKTGFEVAQSVLDTGLAADPENMDLLLAKGQVAALSGKLDEMISIYQKIIDMKDRPVSLTGIRLLGIRNRARFSQANASVQLANQAKEGEARAAAVTRAKAFRTTLATFVPEQSPELQFIDASLASIEGNIPKARQLLAEFLKKPGDAAESTVVEATLLMADVGLRSNPPEIGLARENLRKVLSARPGSLEIRDMLGRVERQLQNYEAAAGYYQSILDLDPENENAKKQLALLKTFIEGGKSGDAVVDVILDSQRLAQGSKSRLGDEIAAMKLLESSLEPNKYDPRLVLAILQIKISKNDRDGAKQVCDAALQKLSPEGATEEVKAGINSIKEYRRRLAAAETVKGAIELVDEQTNVSVVDKHFMRYRTYLEFNKKEEAEAALQEAIKAGPDDFRIIEVQFQRALAKVDTAEAAKLAERAAKLDLDRAEGETFKARIQIAQRNYREAAATLGRVVERGNATAAVYRLLGLVQAELGRVQDAKASFQRAMDLTPNDLVTAKTYISVLIKAGESSKALEVARSTEVIGRGDPEFLNTWLALESQAGNNDKARISREQIRERNPKDTENTAALIDIYIDEKSWDAARKLIDAMRAESDSLRAASLDARWHADRGDMKKATDVFKQYIGQLYDKGEKELADPYIVFGQFLFRHGQETDGMAALKQAIRYQDPATRSVEIMLGDIQLNSGLFEAAEKTYRSVLEAKVSDPEMKIRKRLIEALNQQKKYAEAETVIAELGPRADDDVELFAQRAAGARGMGNLLKAREILDRAVAKFPDEPMPYLRRARMIMLEPGMTKDAMADLSTAIKLKPGMWQALRTRAMLQIAAGKPDEGVQDLREAADRNPGNDDLRLEVIDYLIRFGKETDAVDAANNAVKSRPSDVRLLSQIAATFARNGRWVRAAKFYKTVWEQVQDEATTVDYLRSLFKSTPPGTAEAEAALNTSKLKVDKSWRLMLYRGQVKKKLGKEDAWKADTLASFDLACVNSEALMAWTQEVRAAYLDPSVCSAIFDMCKAPGDLQGWIYVAVCRLAAEDPKGMDTAVNGLRAAREKVVDRGLKVAMQQLLSEVLIKQEKWEEAIKELATGLQLSPTDAVFSNNIAYIMTENLKKPKEALPFAERACVSDSTNWSFLDTLATALWESGDQAQGLRRLDDAIKVCRNEVERAKMLIKLASWKGRSGDKGGAQTTLREVKEIMTDNATLADLIKTEFQTVTKEVEAAPGK